MIHAALGARSAWQAARALVGCGSRESPRPGRHGPPRERPARRAARTSVEAGRAASRREEVAGAGAAAGPSPPGRKPAGDSEAAPAAHPAHLSGAAEHRALSRRPTLQKGVIPAARSPIPARRR